MPVSEPPPKWGTDDITKFIDTAYANAQVTFVNLEAEYSRISQIDGVLRKLCENLSHMDEWFAAFFVLRSHSTWLAAATLAMSARVAETYIMLRATIENGLYGLHIAKHPDLQVVWLRRHASPNHKSRIRKEFKFGNLVETLSREDANEARVAQTLYDQCIDQGAHPNERALMQNLKIEVGAQVTTFEVKYMNADPIMLGLALMSTARVGVCVLGIFSHVYKTQFDLLGLSAQLPLLRDGLWTPV